MATQKEKGCSPFDRVCILNKREEAAGLGKKNAKPKPKPKKKK